MIAVSTALYYNSYSVRVAVILPYAYKRGAARGMTLLVINIKTVAQHNGPSKEKEAYLLNKLQYNFSTYISTFVYRLSEI